MKKIAEILYHYKLYNLDITKHLNLIKKSKAIKLNRRK